MIKKAVYAYKLYGQHYKPLDQSFFDVARLSVFFAKKFYTTVLHCDSYTKNELERNDVFFDEYVLHDDWPEINTSSQSGIYKVLVVSQQTDPFVLLDLDTIIFAPIVSTADITYGFAETSSDYMTTGNFEYVYEYYYKSYIANKHKIDIPLYWSTFPNNSLVAFKNAAISNFAAHRILNLNLDFKKSSAQFYEQFLLYNFMRFYDAKISFLQKNLHDLSGYNIYQHMGRGFIHLSDYYKDSGKKLMKELSEGYRINLNSI